MSWSFGRIPLEFTSRMPTGRESFEEELILYAICHFHVVVFLVIRKGRVSTGSQVGRGD